MKKIFKVLMGVAAVAMMLLTGTKEVKADPNYFYFEVVEGETAYINALDFQGMLEFKYDTPAGSDWDPVAAGLIRLDFSKPKVYFRAKNSRQKLDSNSFGVENGNVRVGGDILTLLDPSGNPTGGMGSGAFASLFNGCSLLVDASDLKLPNFVSEECYGYMFQGCENLTSAPKLPATVLADWCYHSMFKDCSNLTSAPKLPATVLADYCYEEMFFASGVIELHVGFTEVTSNNLIENWLGNMQTTGILYGPKELIDKANASGNPKGYLEIPDDWTFEVEGGSDDPDPDPDPTPKKDPESTGMDPNYLAYLMRLVKTDDAKEEAPAKVVVDRDTYKSEAPAETVMASESATDAFGMFDLKVHKPDDKSITNQEFLARTLVNSNVKILLTQNIFPRRDLSISENGALKKLTWNNLPKDQAGPVFAVVYNETDGAYVINGTLDANGRAAFEGFRLRPASTITICR